MQFVYFYSFNMMYNELKSVHHCPRPVWVLCVQKLIRFEFVSKDMGGL